MSRIWRAGRSQVVGDIDDGYRVTLAVGQVLTLTIGDPNAADLDLYLLDEAGYIVASSEGVGVTETITVTTAGTYIIDVYAYSGAANYILTIGQAVGIVSTPRLSVLSEFVPGELIARFKPAKTGEQSIGMRLSVMGLQMTASDSTATQRPVLVRIDETFLTATTKMRRRARCHEGSSAARDCRQTRAGAQMANAERHQTARQAAGGALCGAELHPQALRRAE